MLGIDLVPAFLDAARAETPAAALARMDMRTLTLVAEGFVIESVRADEGWGQLFGRARP